MSIDHDKIQSALRAIDVDQENLKKYFYEIILDSLYLMHKTMKDKEKWGIPHNKGYSLDDLANLYLVFSSQQSKDSKNEALKQTT
ncbi:hypothetical protein EB118_07855 [bacterium]|nr:hypothetical protein [bacterium]NDG29992.1 hypothetical protein [bacterium]